MRAEIDDWNNGWYGVSLALSITEIDRLIELLTNISKDPVQHFHISSDYAGSGGVGDSIALPSAEQVLSKPL